MGTLDAASERKPKLCDIGAADGTEDDYAAYKTIDMEAAPWTDENGIVHQGNGGRHVMQVGTRLVDGQKDGYTGALSTPTPLIKYRYAGLIKQK